ncbi:hypothetical protein NECAME_12200 [Necator americanus]|uniref:Hyccin n=1 Tax=Necator americanus TaxID=51031 RepID=W2T275_NECAM|nr:hypothetical protein NECAME_12200 [Necator americanus]ETN75674.1 hypothetical protein NECAME_12200 [Necator americanus]
MNGDQLQDFLTDLSRTTIRLSGRDDVEVTKKFLAKDVDLVQPLFAQILALYYKGALLYIPLEIVLYVHFSGVLRQYALQFIPSFIGTYLYALSKKQQKSVAVFEIFFLAVYNEEILENTPNSEKIIKKVEEVRIPSIRYPSIYHDPTKISAVPEVVVMKPGNSPSVLVSSIFLQQNTTVRIGPYPTIEEFNSESKFLILTRILKAVNGSLAYLSSDVVSRHICLAALSICESGFTFPETNFVSKVMGSEHSFEVLEDYSKKPRQHVNSALLLELLTGVYMALYNGAPDLALRAIDAMHQRAQYEILADVILVTSAVRNSLLENPLSKEKRDELMWGRNHTMEKRRKGLVTSASLRMRKMPEDIPIQPELKEKEHSILEEGMDNLKRRVSALGLHHKIQRRRKSSVDDEVELQTIREEKSFDVGDGHQRMEEVIESPRRRSVSEELARHRHSIPENVVLINYRPKSGDEDKILDDNRNGVPDELDYRRESLPSVERPSELRGEHCVSSSEDSGAYTVCGLRHMDSGSSTQRSFDF